MVRMLLPLAATASTKQAFTVLPSRMTVQPPQPPVSHPFLVPVSSRSSRRTSNRLRLGSTATSYSSPLTVSLIRCFIGLPPPGQLPGLPQEALLQLLAPQQSFGLPGPHGGGGHRAQADADVLTQAIAAAQFDYHPGPDEGYVHGPPNTVLKIHARAPGRRQWDLRGGRDF